MELIAVAGGTDGVPERRRDTPLGCVSAGCRSTGRYRRPSGWYCPDCLPAALVREARAA